jgi:energy-coupling factor transport system permease protein
MLTGAFMAIPITFTIPPTRFGVAFRGLGLGDRIAFAVDLAIRLVPTYAEDFRSTMDAQRARGFELDVLRGGFIERIRRLAPLAVPVTMNAIMSGEDITDALDMRGFGLKPRTWLHARPLAPVDRLLIGFGLALFFGGIAWRIFGGGQLWVPPYPFGAV